MTVPSEYLRATEHFYAFLLNARDTAGICASEVCRGIGPGWCLCRRFHGLVTRRGDSCSSWLMLVCSCHEYVTLQKTSTG
jgi:hypothetical protein